jgi:hypothetical protein
VGDCVKEDKTPKFATQGYSFHFFTTSAAF